VAVPTVWSFTYLSEPSKLMIIEMEVASREVQTYLRGKKSVRLGAMRKTE